MDKNISVMPVKLNEYKNIKETLDKAGVQLVAVSKTKPVADIQELYKAGQLDFGENYVQELVEKQKQLPADIRWHFIGHLQSNKVKLIAPFVYLVQGVDSIKLLREINKEALKNKRTIPVLLQVYIAKEESKFGLDETELNEIVSQPDSFPGIEIRGLMGMASFSNDEMLISKEFAYLQSVFVQLSHKYPFLQPAVLSMGMSGDYKIAIQRGSNMVRIGSLLFGARS